MFGRYFDISHDMLCVASDEGMLLQVNDAWTRTLGWTAEELCSARMDRLIHPDDLEATRAERARLFSGGPTFEFRNRYATSAGDWRWLEWRAVYDHDSHQVFGAARDVTEQVMAQRGLELREELLTRVIDEQLAGHDHEHRHFANELHDSVMQYLVAALMYLEIAETNCRDSAAAHPLELGIKQVRASLGSVRRVMQGLDPFDLGDLDLRSSTTALAEEFAQQLAIDVRVDVDLAGDPGPVLAGVAYRVIREALVNVGKHAGATVVDLRIASEGDQLVIEVGSDRAGHRMPIPEPVPGSGLGLTMMRERVRGQGGEFTFEVDETGSRLRAVLPTQGAATTR